MARSSIKHRRIGFTIVEIMVVIGVIAILLGIVLPMLSGSANRARSVSSAARLADHAKSVLLYCADHKDVYPLGAANAFHAAIGWYQPLIQNGQFSEAAQVDPVGLRVGGIVTYRMSVAMVYTPERMRTGATLPPDEAMSSPVFQHQVAFPGSKGLLYQYYLADVSPPDYWCCAPQNVRKNGPVAWCDGSVTVQAWQDLTGNSREPPIENSIGWPVYSTWNGYLGRDRQ